MRDRPATSGDGAPSRSERIELIFDHASDLIHPDEREAYLREACGDDRELRSAVERLLANDSPGSLRLESVVRDAMAAGDLLPGAVIAGRYALIQKIGEGGMGTVWLAEQEKPKRRVAVKLIRPGMTSRQMLKRFEFEAAVLGRLDHPGIAQIHEAGMFDDGSGARPFFAMEFVDGPPLLDFIAKEHLDVRSRLALFASICDAVHHAHQKGVVHRDLKPGNILVKDSERCPKILDFGVARATDSDLQATTIHTGAGQLIGTLQYMSPEQVEGRAQSVDTRSDVYALGVILYEMLAGKLPYELRERTIATAARVIVEDEPAPLTSVNRIYRGDLNTIVLKALRKDPASRYQSASDLAADVRCYLNDQPIAARPASTIYQLRKFAKRNKPLVGGVIAVILVLIAGMIGTGWGMLEARSERDEAQRQGRIAEAVNDFLNDDLLGRGNPYIGAAHDATLREVIDQAAASIETQLLGDPLVNAHIRTTLAETYFQLGEYVKAIRLGTPAVAVFRDALGEGDVKTNELLHTLIVSHLFAWRQGQDQHGLEQAEALLDVYLPAVQQSLGPDHELTGRGYADYGILRKYQGRDDEAEQAYRAAIAIYDTNDQVQPRVIAVTKENFAILLKQRKKFADAETLFLESIETFQSASGDDSADVAFALNNLGHAYWERGQHEGREDEGLRRARPCFERAIEIRLRRLGADHTETLRSQYSLALVLDAQGSHAEAEALHREVLERRLSVLNEDDIDVLWSLKDLALAIEHQDRLEEAAMLNQTVVERGQPRYGPLRPAVAAARQSLLRILSRMGDDEGIMNVCRDYIAALSTVVADPSADLAAIGALALILLECEDESQRDPPRALALAQRAVDADRSPERLNLLAFALSENGRRQEALAAQREAIDLLPGDAPEEMRKSFEESFAKYSATLTSE